MRIQMRTAALVVAWTAACLATTAVGWVAVDLVGNEVAPTGPAALSQAEVERRIHAAPSPTPSTVTTSGTATSGTATSGTAPVARRSFTAVGGTVVLTCDGTRPSLRSAPRAGFEVSESPEVHDSKISVSFSDGTRRSRVEANCAGGVPAVQIRETTGSASDD
jgi:hypothetical protein